MQRQNLMGENETSETKSNVEGLSTNERLSA